MLLMIVILVVAFLIYRHFTWRAEAWPQNSLRPAPYQSHRGYWRGGLQENTLASFARAKELGFAMVELDVRLSKDKEVVVFHDETLDRLVHISAEVSDLTFAELKEKAWVCSLQEVLTSPNVPAFLNIELKTDRILNAQLEQSVCDVVRRSNAQHRVLFSSFNPLAIYRLSRLLPEVPRALLATKEKEPSNRFYLRYLLLAPYVHANALHLDQRYVTEAEFSSWKRRKIPVAFWTVNDFELSQKLLSSGAMSIITDCTLETKKPS